MKKFAQNLVLWTLLATTLCVMPASAQNVDSLQSEDEKIVYAYGMAVARNIASHKLTPEELDLFVAGLRDGVAGQSKIEGDVDSYIAKVREWAAARGSDASSPRSGAKSGSMECQIYRELTTHPGLKDFPVVLFSLENGYATLAGMSQMGWAQSSNRAGSGGSMNHTFKMIELFSEKRDKASAAVKRATGKDVSWREYSSSSESEVGALAENGMKKACGD